MADPVYKFWKSKFKEAWCQLSEEEQNKHTLNHFRYFEGQSLLGIKWPPE